MNDFESFLEQLADLVADRVVARLNGNGPLAAAAASPNGSNGSKPGDPHLLTAEQVAERLGCSRRYIYAKAPGFPFTVRLGRLVRFSAAGLERWLMGRVA